MRLLLPIVTLLAATAAFPGAGKADPLQCTGPFRQCAIEVQAQCTRDRGGRQRMTYWDRPGYTFRFEQCVSRIFVAAGQPDPYKTGITRAGNLTVPYTELLYPLGKPL